MSKLYQHFLILFIGLFVTGLFGFFTRYVVISNLRYGKNDAFDTLGSSMVSAITMNDRWVTYKTVFEKIHGMDNELFRHIASSMKELYNPRITIVKKFNNESNFYDYISSIYTREQFLQIVGYNIRIDNSSWPIIYSYPTNIDMIGYDVSSIQSVNESIYSMESTGQGDIIHLPKNLTVYQTDTIVYGAPIRYENESNSYVAIRVSVENALLRETNAIKYLGDIYVSIYLIKDSISTAIYSSKEDTCQDVFYEYVQDWDARTSIRITFSSPYIPFSWYFYTILSLGIMVSFFLTYIDVKYEQKDELDMQKSRFISSISHEIRTPMNGIMGIIEEIKIMDMVKRHLPLCEHVRTIRSCTYNLLGIVTNILSLSQIESKKISSYQTEFNTSRIGDCITTIWETMRNDNNVSLEIIYENIPQDTRICGDFEKIKQVIYNLVSNAAKFTKHGGINICISWEKVVPIPNRENENVEISIKITDTGVGIPHNLTNTIFTPFFNIKDSGFSQGAGVGLAVSKCFSEAMGGSLTCESVYGTGSTFDFRFRVVSCFQIVTSTKFKMEDVCHIKQNTIEEKQSETKKEHRCLIVDDNVINIKILKRIVEKSYFSCDTAINGLEAIDMCNFNVYDIIFMDKFMPECNGIDATISIRKSGKNKETCIVFVTADTTESSAEECFISGGTEYVSKPIVASNIRDLLKKYIV